jgi:hypothetical protein
MASAQSSARLWLVALLLVSPVLPNSHAADVRTDLDADISRDGVIDNDDPRDNGYVQNNPPGLPVTVGALEKLVLRCTPKSVAKGYVRLSVVSGPEVWKALKNPRWRFRPRPATGGHIRVWKDPDKTTLILDSHDLAKQSTVWRLSYNAPMAFVPLALYVEGVVASKEGGDVALALEYGPVATKGKSTRDILVATVSKAPDAIVVDRGGDGPEEKVIDIDGDINRDGTIVDGDPTDDGEVEDKPPGLPVAIGALEKLVLRCVPKSRTEGYVRFTIMSGGGEWQNLQDPENLARPRRPAGGHIRVWEDPERTKLILDSHEPQKMMVVWALSDKFPVERIPTAVYAEGVVASRAAGDVVLVLGYGYVEVPDDPDTLQDILVATVPPAKPAVDLVGDVNRDGTIAPADPADNGEAETKPPGLRVAIGSFEKLSLRCVPKSRTEGYVRLTVMSGGGEWQNLQDPENLARPRRPAGGRIRVWEDQERTKLILDSHEPERMMVVWTLSDEFPSERIPTTVYAEGLAASREDGDVVLVLGYGLAEQPAAPEMVQDILVATIGGGSGTGGRRAEQLAIWTFKVPPDPLPALGIANAMPPRIEDVVGTPYLVMLNADIAPYEKLYREGNLRAITGRPYTDVEGQDHTATLMAGWIDIKKGDGKPDAEFGVRIATTGWEDIKLRFDYKSESADSFRLDYSTDNGIHWTPATAKPIGLRDGNAWQALPFVDLSAIDAIQHQPSVTFRFHDLKATGNDIFCFDNLEFIGVRAPTPPEVTAEQLAIWTFKYPLDPLPALGIPNAMPPRIEDVVGTPYLAMLNAAIVPYEERYRKGDLQSITGRPYTDVEGQGHTATLMAGWIDIKKGDGKPDAEFGVKIATTGWKDIKLRFDYKSESADSFRLDYSTDNGIHWTAATAKPIGLQDGDAWQALPFVDLSAIDAIENQPSVTFRFYDLKATGNGKFCFDNLEFIGVRAPTPPEVTAEQLAIWTFKFPLDPVPALGIPNAMPPRIKDVVGTPYLVMLNADIVPYEERYREGDLQPITGQPYTDVEGQDHEATLMAGWIDIKKGDGKPDAEFGVKITTTGWKDIKLRFDYKSESADSVRLDYSTDDGLHWTAATARPIGLQDGDAWQALPFVDLSAIDAIENQPSVLFRFYDLKATGNGKFCFDNLEFIGDRVPPTPGTLQDILGPTVSPAGPAADLVGDINRDGTIAADDPTDNGEVEDKPAGLPIAIGALEKLSLRCVPKSRTEGYVRFTIMSGAGEWKHLRDPKRLPRPRRPAGGRIRVWKDLEKTKLILDSHVGKRMMVVWTLSDEFPIESIPTAVYVEGVVASRAAGDVVLVLGYGSDEVADGPDTLQDILVATVSPAVPAVDLVGDINQDGTVAPADPADNGKVEDKPTGLPVTVGELEKLSLRCVPKSRTKGYVRFTVMSGAGEWKHLRNPKRLPRPRRPAGGRIRVWKDLEKTKLILDSHVRKRMMVVWTLSDEFPIESIPTAVYVEGVVASRAAGDVALVLGYGSVEAADGPDALQDILVATVSPAEPAADLVGDINRDGTIAAGDPGDNGEVEDKPSGLPVAIGALEKLSLRCVPKSRTKGYVRFTVMSGAGEWQNLQDPENLARPRRPAGGHIRVWEDPERTKLILDSHEPGKMMVVWTLSDEFPIERIPTTVYAEGVEASGEDGDVVLVLDYGPTEETTGPGSLQDILVTTIGGKAAVGEGGANERGEQLAIWTFKVPPDPLPALGIPNAMPPRIEDVVGTPYLVMLNAYLAPYEQLRDPERQRPITGRPYTDVEGQDHEATLTAGWIDIKKDGGHPDAEFVVSIATTGWEDIKLRFDYRSESADSFRLDYSTDYGIHWTPATAKRIALRDGYAWRALPFVDLSAIDAIEHQPSVLFRFYDLKDTGDNKFCFDNLEFIGVRAPTPPEVTAEQLAIWTFKFGLDPLPALGIPNAMPPRIEDVVGTPYLVMLNADIVPYKKRYEEHGPQSITGRPYTDVEGQGHTATLMAGWIDIRKGGGDPDAEFGVKIATTGWKDIKLRFDYKSQSADSFRLDYSTDDRLHWTAATARPIGLRDGNAWRALPFVDLSAIDAIEHQPSVTFRFYDLKATGDGEFCFDNLEFIGDRVPPTIEVAATTTSYLSLPAQNEGYVSGVIGDPTDPAQVLGIDFTIADWNTPVERLAVTAVSVEAAPPVAQVQLDLTGADARWNLKITPISSGYADIHVAVSDGMTASTYVVHYAASAPAPNPVGARFHTGVSDVAAATAVDTNTMLAANDEDRSLWLYHRGNSGLSVKEIDTAPWLGLRTAGETDVESCARDGARAYWIGSHGNNKDGEYRDNRCRFFATTISGTGDQATVAKVGYYGDLRVDLVAWDSGNTHGKGANHYGLEASTARGIEPNQDDGFNIEGLAMGATSSTVYVGFRTPIVPASDRTKALVVPVTNARALVSGSPSAGPAAFGPPIELDLGGRGIQGMSRTTSGSYLIVAGRAGDATGTPPNDFRLYSWSGNPLAQPALLQADLTSLNPGGSFEAIVEPVGGVGGTIQLLSDSGSTDWYGDGVKSKTLNANWQKFRSDWVTPGSPTPSFAITLGGSREDVAYSVVRTADGGYILGGYTNSSGAGRYDLWACKLDGAGNIQWQKTYGGPKDDGSEDYQSCIRQTPDGGYIFVGCTASSGAGRSDVWVLRLDAAGAIVWQKTYGGTELDRGTAVAVCSDGGFAVAGFTYSFGVGKSDIWVLKLKADGTVAWQSTYGTAPTASIPRADGYDGVNGIEETATGDLLVTGSCHRTAMLMALTPAGAKRWVVSYGGPGAMTRVRGAATTSDQGYVLAGGSGKCRIRKVSAAGATTWEKSYSGAGLKYGTAVDQTPDGGYIAAAFGLTADGRQSTASLLRLDSTGGVVWCRSYGGTSLDHFSSVSACPDGTYVVGGHTKSFGAGDDDMLIYKAQADGTIPGYAVGAPVTVTIADGGVGTSNVNVFVRTTSVTGVNTTVTPANSFISPNHVKD